MRVLATVRDAGLPDAWVGAGLIRDLVWGELHGDGFRPGDLNDVDVAFFDPRDLSRGNDDAATEKLRAAAPDVPWQAKNQAAVHTWYAERFGGEPVEPLRSIADAVGTWPETATAVAVRLDHDDRLHVCAPYGLDDLLGGVWRRNPRRVSPEYSRQRRARQRPAERWPGVTVVTDWVRWHDEYADPDSPLSRRRAIVQRELRAALDRDATATRLISMCAGDGGDVLPILATRPGIEPLLLEMDPELARRAGTTSADAGVTDPYLGYGRAHILLACGVFGNVSADDTRRTIATLPGLMESGGVVIWSRAGDESEHVRDLFAGHGFEELGFVRPDDARFRVGVHRLTTAGPPPPYGMRMFGFGGEDHG
ncbi:nucleotidyltransferase family protein [Actinoplanes sp. TBRC 11911]|nr:nucleotidyltransferase family protein [Actinoplanes sp. TBRC 11911]